MLPYSIPESSVVKITARTALKGRWCEAILAAFTGYFGTLILTLSLSLGLLYKDTNLLIVVAVLALLFGIFVLSPLFLGIFRYFWRLTASIQDELRSVFYFFSDRSRYIRAIKLCFIMGWRIITAIFVCMLPYVIVSALSTDKLYMLIGRDIPIWAPSLNLVRAFLYLVGVVCAVIYVLRYYLVPVLVAMNDDMLLLEAVHTSSMVAKRSGGAFFRLAVSMLGWILLTNLIMPALYTLPLIFACYVVHCRFAMANYNLILDYYENNVGYYQ